MLSTPPATINSASPTRIARAALPTASIPEPHRRLNVTPGTSGGRPARSPAIRATFRLSSPAWFVHPYITSFTPPQSTEGFRFMSSTIGVAARSSVRTADRQPAYLPIGVRTASQIEASGICVLLVGIDRRRSPSRDDAQDGDLVAAPDGGRVFVRKDHGAVDGNDQGAVLQFPGRVGKPLLQRLPESGDVGHGLIDDDRPFRGSRDPLGERDLDGESGDRFREAAMPLERRDAGAVQAEEVIVTDLQRLERGPVDLLPGERPRGDLLLEPSVGERVVLLRQSEAGIDQALDPGDVPSDPVQLRRSELLPRQLLQLQGEVLVVGGGGGVEQLRREAADADGVADGERFFARGDGVLLPLSLIHI